MQNHNSLEEKIQRLVDIAFKNKLKCYKIDKSSASQCGNNWLGEIYRIKINGFNKNEEEVHFSLIVKIAPYQPLFRKLLAIRKDYEREIYAYNKIIPEFIQIQKEKCIETLFDPFAKCYASTMENSQEGLLMDDMKMKEFVPLNYQEGVDYHHASLIMKALGKFHALSFAIQDQKPIVFDEWKAACLESFFNSDLYEPLTNILTNLCCSILKTYNETDKSNVREIFQRSIKTIPDVFKNLLDVERYGKHCVISYGDYQVRNFLFQYKNSAKPKIPTDICLLDFQCLKLGTPASDISYFISTCTDKQMRSNYYSQLIQDYYQSLSSFLSQLGSDPKMVFPYEALLDHLKKFSVFGMYVGIWLVALDQKPKDNLPDLHNVTDKETLIYHLSVVPNDIYMERARDLISDFIDYGYEL